MDSEAIYIANSSDMSDLFDILNCQYAQTEQLSHRVVSLSTAEPLYSTGDDEITMGFETIEKIDSNSSNVIRALSDAIMDTCYFLESMDETYNCKDYSLESGDFGFKRILKLGKSHDDFPVDIRPSLICVPAACEVGWCFYGCTYISPALYQHYIKTCESANDRLTSMYPLYSSLRSEANKRVEETAKVFQLARQREQIEQNKEIMPKKLESYPQGQYLRVFGDFGDSISGSIRQGILVEVDRASGTVKLQSTTYGKISITKIDDITAVQDWHDGSGARGPAVSGGYRMVYTSWNRMEFQSESDGHIVQSNTKYM